MKYFFYLILSMTAILSGYSQNQIRIKGGMLYTNTSVSEYNRGLGYFYYDTVSIDATTSSPHVALDVDVDLNKNFFLITGLSYSKKGLPLIYSPSLEFGYTAVQEYMGMNLQVKYHSKIKSGKFGWFIATGFRTDFAVAGPTSAEIATGNQSEVFNAFGTFKPVDFAFNTVAGGSWRLGPGDITAEVQFLNGLSDVLADRYAVGRTYSTGFSVGYSYYLSE